MQGQLLSRNMKRFRGGLVFKAHRLLYHSTLGSRGIKKKTSTTPQRRREELCVGNLLVRVHCIIVMIRWTGLAPWEVEFPFPGSLTSAFLRECSKWWIVFPSPLEAYLTFGNCCLAEKIDACQPQPLFKLWRGTCPPQPFAEQISN